MAIRWCSDADIDLLTIDGAPGGTGMSPWRMMSEWGIPSIYLHFMAYELSDRLAQKGKRVPDLAFAGGFWNAALNIASWAFWSELRNRNG
jgi:glutamate synthase domain-containing protein 2